MRQATAALSHRVRTRTLAILMRYTGEEKKEEREQALEQAKGWLAKARTAPKPEEEPEVEA
jgi:hypothetical protein